MSCCSMAGFCGSFIAMYKASGHLTCIQAARESSPAQRDISYFSIKICLISLLAFPWGMEKDCSYRTGYAFYVDPLGLYPIN